MKIPLLLLALAQLATPSPEALAACAGRAEGASCTITFEDGEHQGICLKSPVHEAATCMPKPVPPPPVAVPAS
jgi:hypothetical protein